MALSLTYANDIPWSTVTSTAHQGHSYIALDLMRAGAAALVLLMHARGHNWVPFGTLPAAEKTPAVAAFFAVTRLGTEAVLVFFVLSGLLVGGQLITQVRAGRFALVPYAIDRSTRILLPLIPAVLFSVAVAALVHGRPTDIGQVLANMSGLNGVLAPKLHYNISLWSLSYEIWFYVIGGATAYLFTRKGNLAAFLVIGVAMLVFSVLEARYLLYWLLGAAAILLSGSRFKTGSFILGIAIACAGVIFNQVADQSRSVFLTAYLSPATAQLLICAGVALTFPRLMTPAADQALARAARPVQFLSRISYSLYLIHYPTLLFIDHLTSRFPTLGAASWGLFLLRLAVCFAVAGAFYWMFERNTGWARRRLRNALCAPAPPGPVPAAPVSGAQP